MNKNAKLIYDILSGTKDSNIIFNDLLKLLRALGFQERVKGDHFIFYRSDIEEIINIQPNGNKAKPYQVKQIRNLLTKYKLGGME